MTQDRPGTRLVEVNMNPGGRVHEIGCRWVQGALTNDRTDPTSYKTIPANQVPAGKKHCSYC